MFKLLRASRIILLLCAVVFACCAAALGAWSAYRIHSQISATAVVTDFSIDHFGKSHAIYQYQDAAGKSHTSQESLGFTNPGVTRGEQIPILYMADHPQKSIIAIWQRLWQYPTICASIALAALLLSIGARILQRRYKPATMAAADTTR